MTQDLTVQGQNPSAMPYVLGGAGLGAAGGYASAKWGNLGINGQAYKSWDEAVEATNKDDKFVRNIVEKKGDNATVAQEILDESGKVKTLQEAVNKIEIPKEFEAKAELDDMITKQVELKAKQREEILKIMNKAEEFKYTPAGGAEVTIKKADYATKLDEAFDDILKSVEGDDAFKNATKDAKEAMDKAEKAFNDKKPTGDWIDGYKKAKASEISKLNELKTKAVGELDKIKKASTWKTALAAAAVLGLGGWLLKPNAEEA